MTELRSLFAKVLKEVLNIRKDERILMAVSGGLDSIVMTHLFKQEGYDCAIAHVNFQLRGKNSDLDESFVRQIAERLDIPFYLHRESPEERMNTRGESIQMAAREIRYDFFYYLMEKEKFDKIAMAHHLNDDFETALMNFIKGPSYSSIAGIPRKGNRIIRPFLEFSKEDIRIYAEENEISWREDSSNEKDDYLRNKIRHHLAPMIHDLNPGYLKTFRNHSKHLSRARAYLKYEYQNNKKWLEEKSGEIVVDLKYFDENEDRLFLLDELLRKKGFNRVQIEHILECLHIQSGKVFYSGNMRLLIDRNKIILTEKASENDVLIEVQENMESLHFDDKELIITKEKELEFNDSDMEAFLDCEKLKFPMFIRKWQDGDKFKPLGMTGFKKVSDYLVDVKMPLHKKEKQLVLTSGEDIVWLIGQRIDERFKLSKNCNEVYHLKLNDL